MKTISETGLAFLKSNESCSLTSYEDPPGSPGRSIGWGHYLGVSSTTTSITQEQADALLVEDLRYYQACVNNRVHVELTQAQFDALVDFCYNEGCGALIRSTLLRVLNTGDYDSAAEHFLEWDKVSRGGKLEDDPILYARRVAERKMFLSDAPTNPDLPAA